MENGGGREVSWSYGHSENYRIATEGPYAQLATARAARPGCTTRLDLVHPCRHPLRLVFPHRRLAFGIEPGQGRLVAQRLMARTHDEPRAADRRPGAPRVGCHGLYRRAQAAAVVAARAAA